MNRVLPLRARLDEAGRTRDSRLHVHGSSRLVSSPRTQGGAKEDGAKPFDKLRAGSGAPVETVLRPYCRNMFLAMKKTLAGRSASRRMK
jgi:hypothetical protein